MLPFKLSSGDIEISVVSQYRILVPVQYMNTQPFYFFLQLTICTCWSAQQLVLCRLRLTQTELADWQQTWNTNTNLKLTQTAATLYTGCTLPTKSTLLAAAAADASTTAEQLQPQQPSHDDMMHNKCYLWDFQETVSNPHQNSIAIPMQTLKALYFAKLKMISESYCACTSCLYMPWGWERKVCSVLHNYK